MSGNCATGSPTIATSPRSTVRIEMTIATTGRLMKKRAMALLLPRRSCGGGAAGRCLRRDDWSSRLDSRESFHDRPVTWLQAGVDNPETAYALSRNDLPDLDLAIDPDDADLIGPLHFVDRPLRDEERSLLRLDDSTHLRVLARPQDVARVREEPYSRDRAGLHIDLTPGQQQVSLVRERRAIRQHQLQACVLHCRILLVLHVLLFAELIADADWIPLRDDRQNRLRAHQVTDLLLGQTGNAADRGRDPRP